MAHVVYKEAHACKSGCGHDHGPKTDHDDHLPIIKDPFGEVDARNLEVSLEMTTVPIQTSQSELCLSVFHDRGGCRRLLLKLDRYYE